MEDFQLLSFILDGFCIFIHYKTICKNISVKEKEMHIVQSVLCEVFINDFNKIWDSFWRLEKMHTIINVWDNGVDAPSIMSGYQNKIDDFFFF